MDWTQFAPNGPDSSPPTGAFVVHKRESAQQRSVVELPKPPASERCSWWIPAQFRHAEGEGFGLGAAYPRPFSALPSLPSRRTSHRVSRSHEGGIHPLFSPDPPSPTRIPRQKLGFRWPGGPVIVMILEKSNAISDWRALIGPTDPTKAKISHPESIRAMCGTDIERNCVHGSDSSESAAKEITFFFGEMMLSGFSSSENYLKHDEL
ncbi:hypothetical protein Taro_033002 [Colocasia esculenta]|uniref:Nucleoside diphosphate kinase-like domain-containing protein n=1 Tax=Colocasia esculenta TaxID=4460 RepID=A0A843VU49_COLES|nr:hypothetical protein [Colocasia esculenta]